MIERFTRQPAVRWYLYVLLSVTVLAGVTQWLLAPPTGLIRTFYLTRAVGSAPQPPERTTDISLAFLEQDPTLPRLFFGVQWEGYWYMPRAATVELFAGADDRVDIWVDGQLVHRRSPAAGMHMVGKAISVRAGAHRIVVRYEQDGGATGLSVLNAAGDESPGPLAPTQLFPDNPDALDYAFATVSAWFTRLTVLLWATLLGGLLLTGLVWGGNRVVGHWWANGVPATVGEFGRRLYPVSFPALLVSFLLCFVGPHTIYGANSGEFSGAFLDIVWPWLLLATAGGWATLVAIGGVTSLVSERLTRLYSVLLLALGVLIWAQGNLWVGDYGVLDGREIEWDRLAGRVPYELGAWVAVPFLAAVFVRQVSRLTTFTAQLFLALQIGGLAVTWGGTAADQQTRWQEPPPELFQFSAERNVIHIVLDEFQSDAFAAILEDDRPWFDESFAGFTFFADHLGAFPSTSLSMPALLTGREYRNEQPVPQFVREAFSDWSIFRSLSAAGYAIDATSILRAPWFEAWFMPEDSPVNEGAARFSIRKPFVSRQDYREFTGRQLLELSIARHVPHVAKVALAENGSWFDRLLFFNRSRAEASNRRHEASNSAAFFEQFIDRMQVGRGRPVYKLLHLGVPHRPVVLDADCRFIDRTRFSAGAYLGQSRCALNLTAAFLDRLRRLGIYDSSLIVLSSDHGTSWPPPNFVGQSPGLPLRAGASTAGLPAIVGTARPLMAIKPPGPTGPLAISNAPTTHVDLPGTMLRLLGLSHSRNHVSMLELSDAADRRRVFGMYNLRFRFPERYLNRLDLLTIDRVGTDATGWDWERSVLSPDRDLPLSDGDVDFGEGRNTPYLGPGWSRGVVEGNEHEKRISFVGATSERAVIFVSLPEGVVELVARMSAPSDLESIHVSLDGRTIDHWQPGERRGYQDYVARLPPNPERPHISALTFRFDGSTADDFLAKLDRISASPR